jgi:hypothetical protein
MENLDKKQSEENVCKGCLQGKCCCGMHGMHGMHGCCGGGHHLVKIILKILIIIIIFWSGFRLGEVTGSIRGEYGRGMMNGNNYYGMMRGYNYNNPTGVTPTTPTPTPAK